MPYIIENGVSVYVTADDPRLATSTIEGQAESYTGTATTTASSTSTGPVTTEQIKAIFDAAGVTIATPGETEQQRLQRLVDQINSGAKTLQKVTSDIEAIAANPDYQYDPTQSGFVGGTSQSGTYASVEQQVLEAFTSAGIPFSYGARPGETDAQRLDRIVNEILRGDRDIEHVKAALSLLQTKQGDRIRIRPGAQWYKVGTEFYAAYELPGGSTIWHTATPDELEAIFPDAGVPDAFITLNESQWESAKKGWYYTGSISEAESEMEEPWSDAVRRALEGAAGGILPTWIMESPAIQDLLFIATAEEWSNSKLIMEISKTSEFSQRFPAIDKFYSLGMDIQESVEAYRQYEYHINSLAQAYYGRSASANEVAGLIEQGHSAEGLSHAFATFDRMRQYAPALEAFNSILASQGMQPLDEEGVFEFLSGRAEPEYYQLYESSSILEQGQAAGLGGNLNAAEAYGLAQATTGVTTPKEAYSALTVAAKDILRYRAELDLDKYDLNIDDIIDLAMGVAPRSGNPQAEISRNMERATAAARGFLQDRVNPYFAYSASGKPGAASLANLRQESV